MTAAATIGGVRFLMDTLLIGTGDTGFSDLELEARWFEGDAPDATMLAAPMGLHLWIDREAGVVHLPVLDDEVEMRSWQLRQVAPTVAAFYDRLTLHASAVSVDGRVLAFVAGSGTGKTTLAWALVKAGAAAISDDLLPIRFDDRPVVPTDTDRLPVAALCFLDRHGGDLAESTLEPALAMRRHIANGFGEHGEPSVWGFQFDAYHRLVTEVPHVDLVVPDDREQVASVAERLIDLVRTGGLGG